MLTKNLSLVASGQLCLVWYKSAKRDVSCASTQCSNSLSQHKIQRHCAQGLITRRGEWFQRSAKVLPSLAVSSSQSHQVMQEKCSLTTHVCDCLWCDRQCCYCTFKTPNLSPRLHKYTESCYIRQINACFDELLTDTWRLIFTQSQHNCVK